MGDDVKGGQFTVCDTPNCPNQGRPASHPRSSRPWVCGICGYPVRLIDGIKPRWLHLMAFRTWAWEIERGL